MRKWNLSMRWGSSTPYLNNLEVLVLLASPGSEPESPKYLLNYILEAFTHPAIKHSDGTSISFNHHQCGSADSDIFKSQRRWAILKSLTNSNYGPHGMGSRQDPTTRIYLHRNIIILHNCFVFWEIRRALFRDTFLFMIRWHYERLSLITLF